MTPQTETRRGYDKDSCLDKRLHLRLKALNVAQFAQAGQRLDYALDAQVLQRHAPPRRAAARRTLRRLSARCCLRALAKLQRIHEPLNAGVACLRAAPWAPCVLDRHESGTVHHTQSFLSRAARQDALPFGGGPLGGWQPAPSCSAYTTCCTRGVRAGAQQCGCLG